MDQERLGFPPRIRIKRTGNGPGEGTIQILDAALGFARANPVIAIFGLLAILAGLGLIVVGLVRRSPSDIGDIGAGRPAQRHEPDFGRGYSHFDEDDGGPPPSRRNGRASRRPARRSRVREERTGFGFVALFFVFILGIAVGAGGLTFARGHDFGPTYKLARGYAKRAIALVVGYGHDNKAPQDKATEEKVVQEKTVREKVEPPQPAEPAKPTASEERVPEIPVEQRAATYVKVLARQLPKRIDSVTTLVSATLEDRAVILGYSVGQTVTEGDAADFANAMRAQIESKTCSLAKTSDMRDLNDRGIEFRLIYSDQVGKTIARVDLAANFCGSKPG